MANTKITTNVIADDAITSAKIADDAVGNDQLASGLTLGGNTTATLATAAQTNITRLGTLTTLTVDDITIDGSTISDGGDLTIDVVGGIVLDADDSGTISFKDGGTRYGLVQKSSNNFEIQSMISDGDLVIKGNDGGSTITALTLDMSAAGAATFNDLVDAKNFKINGGQGSDGQVLTSTGSGVAWEDAAGGVAGISSSADATAITISSSELVGIGESSPTHHLHVNAGTTNVVAVFESTDTEATIRMKDNTGTAAIKCRNDFRFNTSETTERMRIDSSGDVLIGQTSQTGYTFAQKLVVGDGDANDGITIQSGSTHQGNLAFNHSDGTTAHGRILYQHDTNYMAFFTNNAEKMRIATDGSIGIGTTDTANAKVVITGGVSAGADTACIDIDGYGSRGEGASQSINFRMGRTGQATDQPAQIKSFFMGGGATAGQTSVGFMFTTIAGNTQQDQFLIDAAYSRFKFNTSESPQSNNPQTNNCLVIGPSSSGAVTQSLTNACVLQNRSGELYAVDSSHNNTQLTPHNWGLISSGPSEELAWTYYSQRPNPSNNEQLQTINVDMAKVIRKVEDLVGEKLIYTENSEKDGHTFKTIISDIQTTLADLKTRVEALEG